MKKIDKDLWEPADGLKLEENALKVVKSDLHSLVIAGPGAGKTELLAQRACYLLQTNDCKFPKKILAISFKADAALNLKERVLLRCGSDLSKRFDSMTFDAFAKSILDRFKSSLPPKFLIKNKYSIAVTDDNILDEFKFNDIDYFNLTPKNQLLSFFYNPGLPYAVNNSQEILKDRIWMVMLNEQNPRLPFKMIMRLAELIIARNAIIKHYLQKTYQYVFLDEFQDTTTIQYDFLTTCFFHSSCNITAVGDDKQRIMVWAGAKETAFNDLKKDVGALVIPLFMNFRSAPRLVALQNYLVQNLLKKTELATAAPRWNPEDGECNVWIFENPSLEKERLFDSLKKWIEIDQVDPRDICILVKQQLNVYVGDLIDHLNSKGIRARDESELQNLLTEELVLYFINMLYYIFGEKQTLAYQFVFELLRSFHGYETDSDLISLEIKINQFKSLTIDLFKTKGLTKELVHQAIENMVDLAGIANIKAKFQRYSEQAYYEYVTRNFARLLFQELEHDPSMLDALDSVSGKGTIPVMTVHKSKGLEYHTVIFVGLEDNAFWTYQTQPDEDRCTFFVALSRAKNRVVFTFSKIRYDKFNRERSQNIEKIGDILAGLHSSGLVTISDN